MTTLGKVWLNIEKNECRGDKIVEEILENILNG